MLGEIWDVSESVIVNEGDKNVILRGKRVEVVFEFKNKLRLSLIETFNNRGS